MIKTFKDEWLDQYYFYGIRSAQIPATIESALKRKLDILHSAGAEQDLRIPPGNCYERLQGKLSGLCSIRVNKQYRLIFRWHDYFATEVSLDPHRYR